MQFQIRVVAAKIDQNMADLFFWWKIFSQIFCFSFCGIQFKALWYTRGKFKRDPCMHDAIYLVAPPALFVWHNKGIIQAQYGSWVSATAAEFDRLPTQNSCFNPSLLYSWEIDRICCLSFFLFWGVNFPLHCVFLLRIDHLRWQKWVKAEGGSLHIQYQQDKYEK